MPKLVSIQVAQPAWHVEPGTEGPDPQRFRTAIYKTPIARPVTVELLGVVGDGQADRKHHGGTDKAVLGYSADHYPSWQPILAPEGLPYGAFGENLTLSGQTEADVCIGDLWQIGTTQLQISQPRQPCSTLSRRWARPQLVKEVVEVARGGWYFRVLQPGVIESGMDCTLLSRPRPAWTVERAFRTYFDRPKDRVTRQSLADVPELSSDWRDELLG